MQHMWLQGGQVVYFRARQGGACTYFDDRRDGPLPHGLCWAPLCKDLQIVDVPGDHFSLLRQDEKDMTIIVDALQRVLSAFGWHTTIKQEQKVYTMNDVSCAGYMHNLKLCIASVTVCHVMMGIHNVQEQCARTVCKDSVQGQYARTMCKDNVLCVL